MTPQLKLSFQVIPGCVKLIFKANLKLTVVYEHTSLFSRSRKESEMGTNSHGQYLLVARARVNSEFNQVHLFPPAAVRSEAASITVAFKSLFSVHSDLLFVIVPSVVSTDMGGPCLMSCLCVIKFYCMFPSPKS